MSEKETSTLSEFIEEKGFGFIKSYNSEDYFFHISDVTADRPPTKADVLAFDVVEGEKGPRAVNVDIVDES